MDGERPSRQLPWEHGACVTARLAVPTRVLHVRQPEGMQLLELRRRERGETDRIQGCGEQGSSPPPRALRVPERPVHLMNIKQS